MMLEVKFKDTFDFQKKSKIKAGDGLKLDEGEYPFYTSSNTLTKSINEYLFKKESLIFGTGGLASIHYCDEKFAVSTDCFVTQSKNSEEVFLKYIYYYLSGNIHILENGFKGAGLKHISKGYISDIKIPLPPLDQQKKIAAILDAADTYRQKTKALITKYDALTQSLFLDMFGDPVANPKGWEVNQLKGISTKIHSGNTPKGGSKVYVKEGITFFRSQNVWKNRIVYDGVAFIDQATQDKMLKSSLKHRDLLMTKTGRINTENSSLGRAAMYLGEDDKANVNGHVYLIRLKDEVINEFVLHILTTKEYRDHIRSVCVGGIDKRQLNKNHLEEFPIISPPLEMQKKFLASLLLMQSHKKKLAASSEHAENLFNSLLQKAFKGELV